MQRPTVQRIKGATAPSDRLQADQLLQTQIQRLEEQFSHLRDQVRQTQQLASLGTAAAMMAHEFNNLMTPVVSYARFALDSDDKELMVKALSMTLKQSSVATSMSERILGLAANEAPSTMPVTIKTVIDDAIVCMCRDPSKDGITVKMNIPDDLSVLADEKQMLQVFFNLLLNARQAIEHRSGRITISAELINADEVVIRIKDNGSGIEPDKLEVVFEPFYTTKTNRAGENRRGCGLGLPLCREIIEEQRGTISVESEVGVGTTFSLTLPLAS